ncbi:hypothetical protein IHE44_0011816, partial [Lamprotornis superbus]
KPLKCLSDWLRIHKHTFCHACTNTVSEAAANVQELFTDVFPAMCGCLQVGRRDIRLLGSVPKKATGQMGRSLSPSRTFLRALNLGIAGINPTDHPHFCKACSRALLRIHHCPQCPGLALSEPCMGCCPNTTRDCLADTAGAGPHCRGFIPSLEELSGALSRAHGIEHGLLNFHAPVRDALGQAQINRPE